VHAFRLSSPRCAGEWGMSGGKMMYGDISKG